MRTDENGNPCPETLGEYRDLVFAMTGNDQNPAVQMLDERIETQGRDAKVVVADVQMRAVLFKLMLDDESVTVSTTELNEVLRKQTFSPKSVTIILPRGPVPTLTSVRVPQSTLPKK